MNAAIAVAHTRLGDLLDALAEGSLPGTARAIVIVRTLDWQRSAGSPDADLPGRAHVVDHLTLPDRLHIFRRITSCSISLSRLRSATNFLSRRFSSSSCLSRFISD